MKFINLNLNDFTFFTGDSLLLHKKILKTKIRNLEEVVYNKLCSEIKTNLTMSDVGKTSNKSEDIWFSLRPKQYKGAENINYNFDISKEGVRYCLNSETDFSGELFKNAVENNKNKFLNLINNIDKNKIWLYKRNLKHGPSGKYLIGKQTWDKIEIYEGRFTNEKINDLLNKINFFDHSAVRIGKSFGKNEPITTSQSLPDLLVELTENYFELFKFLNNL